MDLVWTCLWECELMFAQRCVFVKEKCARDVRM
jgi:hypothetical protein